MRKKVLLIRLDKIGDLICTLPADQVLDEKQYEITWAVQKGLGQIIDLGEKKRNYFEFDKSDQKNAQKQFANFLKQNEFDYAVSFQCPWWINWELFKAKIKNRIGVKSQWHSFIFLNHAIRQKRSQATQHEFDYNLDLIKKIIGPITVDTKKILFKFKKPQNTNLLEQYNLPPNYVVIHPGMMGSALNWSQDQYIEYIEKHIELGHTVVITGTPADEPYLNKIKKVFENHTQVRWLQSKLSFSELLIILNYAKKVIAPSTGVAHIAASLDKEVHAIFSHVRVHHPRRWAPRGVNVHIHLPAQTCPAEITSDESLCIQNKCMQTINVPV